MKRLYARLVLWLIQLAIDLSAEHRNRIVDQVKREFPSVPARSLGIVQKDR